MELKFDDHSSWAENIEHFKPERTPLRVWSTLMFYRLRGNRTTIVMDNFEVIPNLQYAVFDPKDSRYYIHDFGDTVLSDLFFASDDMPWNTWQAKIRQIKGDILRGGTWVLLTGDNVSEMTRTLEKLYKSYFLEEGKLDYRAYIKIAETSLLYERYKSENAGAKGYKTQCRVFEDKIKEIWNGQYKKKVS